MALSRKTSQDEDRPLSETGTHRIPGARELDRFDRSLKRRQELALLRRLLRPLGDRRCLLVTGGDRGGALNFHLRAAGGRWKWAHTDEDRLWHIASILGEPVSHVSASDLPFRDGTFDRAVVMGALQSTEDPWKLVSEISRVLRPRGTTVLTAPTPRRSLPLTMLDRSLGRNSRDDSRNGDAFDLEAAAHAAGLVSERRGACCRFFTEAIEVAFDGSPPGPPLHSVLKVVASLDYLIPWAPGHTVALVARKPKQLRIETPS